MLLATACAAGALACTPALAQQADDEVSEVVVTGSRITRDGSTAPTPVTVANIEELSATTPTNIPDVLNKLPAFALSRGPQIINNGSSPAAGNYLNLRGFGIPRTLILLDGRRVPPTSFDGTVDVNALPQLLVERVEVVTGGASAVYGSDAVTGVVNFVIDRNFEGFKGLVNAGVSDENDAKSWRAGLAWGGQILDRGHLIVSYEHYQNDGLKAKEDRPYGPRVFGETGAGTAANPFRLTENTRINNSAFGGLILNTTLANQQFLPNGTLGPFNRGVLTTTTGLSVGGDGVYVTEGTLIARLRTDQAYARFEYELTPEVKAFASLSFGEARTVHRFSVEQHTPALLPITIFSGNAFLHPSVQAAMTAGNIPSFNMARYGSLDVPKSETDALTTSIIATVGLEGRLFDRFNWEAYYTRGESRLRLPTRYNTNAQRFYAALDAVRDPSGQIVCRVTLTSPGLYPGCVPLNFFGVGAPSPQALDYIFGTTQFQVINEVDDLAVNVTGELFNTWAGPILAAVGAEYRKNVLDETTNASPTDLPNFTGLRGGFTASTQLWRTNVVAASAGENDVFEVNGEVTVPLARDLPFAKALDVDGAVRYTDYSTSGSVTTWKLGLNWSPIADLRFRATRSRDIRAPSLFDLFGGQQISPTGFTDLHTGQTGITQLFTGGNPNLVPEVAKTITIGLVYTPAWLPGFTLSFDYYDISIDNGLASVAATAPSTQQECEASNGASPLCDLFVRPLPFENRTAANFPTAIRSQLLNVAQTYTHGFDVEASYRFSLTDMSDSLAGDVVLRLLATHQPVLKIRNFATAPVVNTAGAAPLPDTRISFMGRYSLGPLGVDIQTRWIDDMKQSGNTALVFLDPKVKSVSYTDLNVDYQFEVMGSELTAFLTINNIFDKKPPIWADPAVASVPGLRYPVPNQQDIVGRYFTSGVRFRF